jgi:S1-C subfamily serine protease
MRRRWLYILLGIVAFLVVFGLGAVVGGLIVRAIPNDERVVSPRVFVTTGEYGDGGEGILISKVEVESPADRAGLARGDILLEVNGATVDTIIDLQAELANLKPGETVELLVRHGDEELTPSATLGERDGMAYLGIHSGEGTIPGIVGRAPFEPYEKFVFPHGPGPIIVKPGLKDPGLIEPRLDWLPEDVEQALILGQVLPDSPAGEAGLQEGDFITALDGKPVGRPEAFTKAIQAYKPGEQVTLTIYRQGEEKSQEIQVTLAEHPDEAGKSYLGIKLAGFFQRDRGSSGEFTR